jgi:hypothetical protein
LEKIFIANFLGYLSPCSISDFTRLSKLNKIELINPFSTYLGVQFNKLGESDSKLKHWFDFRFHLEKLCKIREIKFSSGRIKSYSELIEEFRIVLLFSAYSFIKQNVHLLNIDNVEFIETQIGEYLEEDDIVRYEDDFGRV